MPALESALPVIPFDSVARLPEPGDNVAIATRRIEAGTRVQFEGTGFTIWQPVMEGHRFAVRRIGPGEELLSWNLPFGKALRAILPGEYVCNAKALEALAIRKLSFSLPLAPNFEDARVAFALDKASFTPGEQIPPAENPLTFSGFARGERGVGTRNYVVVLGTSSLTGSFVRLVAARFKNSPTDFPNVDGVVPVAHTEGGDPEAPNNLQFALRTLAGFVTHPNVAAMVAVDNGPEPLNNRLLEAYLKEQGYPANLPLHFYSVEKSFEAALEEVVGIVSSLLPGANASARSEQPLSALRIALQCGGSDAFSGISANPLIGVMSREAIRHGGSANLAETDELIGAEPYVLANVRDLATAERFLRMAEIFQERAGWHGFNAEGNPSAGNIYRGLYNIIVKSIGAARKKDPKVRLDYAIEYAEPMRAPGFYFMDSPGNDLESISGQVASGCNVIIFTTGNGSITNFPFVPTIKVMTTTARFLLLSRDMDFNAGRYLDGAPMEDLGAEAFELLLRVASGEKTAGERAGHSQAQLWRNWPQTSFDSARQARAAIVQPTGQPLSLKDGPAVSFEMARPPASIALILPTSLCASQVAASIAGQLNTRLAASARPGISRFVTLPHTEGCAVSAADNEEIQLRVMLGHLLHPMVRRALLLEHGCEKIHNDAMRKALEAAKMQQSDFGWASVQMDGGIERVAGKVENYFRGAQAQTRAERPITVGLYCQADTAPPLQEALANITRGVVASGGTLILPTTSLLLEEGWLPLLTAGVPPSASIKFAEIPVFPGLHLMDSPTKHTVENLTALAAAGSDVILLVAGDRPLQAHPFVPTVQISAAGAPADFDLRIDPSLNSEELALELADLLRAAVALDYAPKMQARGNVDFQLSRGHFGVTL